MHHNQVMILDRVTSEGRPVALRELRLLPGLGASTLLNHHLSFLEGLELIKWDRSKKVISTFSGNYDDKLASAYERGYRDALEKVKRAIKDI